jgi:hypothetical protein
LIAQSRGDLVAEHFLQAEAEQVGASRLSGRVTTSPAETRGARGRPWHPAQLSIMPAPIWRW